VFPCRSRDKIPACAHGVKDATTDANIIAGWWRGYPEANIALATGKRSGAFVVDIDSASAETELAKLEAECGTLPTTMESITARGRHLFFAYPDQLVIKNSAKEIAPDIDIRGEDGYVIVPPSVHESGHVYAWKNGVECFAPAPAWLLAKICGRKSGLQRRDVVVTPAKNWQARIRAGFEEGGRNSGIASLTGHFLLSVLSSKANRYRRRLKQSTTNLTKLGRTNEGRSRSPL
jgi:hypothetical protein